MLVSISLRFLGFNPLQNSFDINLKGDYVIADSIKTIETDIKKNEMVSEIIYDKQLVDLVNDNIKKISFWILVISGFFAVIAMLLINSSLRLSIYSHRFTIKTMQMVGATKSFEAEPGSIRGDFGLGFTENIIHASDSIESFDKEVSVVFK